MASDTDWVEDVKRWYLAGRLGAVARPAPAPEVDAPSDDLDTIGYEAADPPLQAVNWPDAADAELT